MHDTCVAQQRQHARSARDDECHRIGPAVRDPETSRDCRFGCAHARHQLLAQQCRRVGRCDEEVRGDGRGNAERKDRPQPQREVHRELGRRDEVGRRQDDTPDQPDHEARDADRERAPQEERACRREADQAEAQRGLIDRHEQRDERERETDRQREHRQDTREQ
jgi:hypothetical protein